MRPVSTPAPSKHTFHPGIEGLRGLAVVVVFLFHHGYSWIQGGFLSVSTFFTLSGFLITGLLVAEHDRTGRIDDLVVDIIGALIGLAIAYVALKARARRRASEKQ